MVKLYAIIKYHIFFFFFKKKKSAWRGTRHLIDLVFLGSVRRCYHITGNNIRNRPISICEVGVGGLVAPNKGHLWAYSLYSDVSEEEMLTLKCYYLRLTMYDHNPINEGRN